MSTLRVVHYINQFFAGIGGEDKANHMPEKRAGVVGPGTALKAAIAPAADIVATVICGDGYFNENLDEATAAVLAMIAEEKPELVI
ncbi:MAG: glycine/betaine/sarcosine/D-proline family reductase selenoprotein B, partial [Clostridia bacterium]|nr:glycine/betaine/sarcosine/D-proline family reductase selenoprotein B [Clostridia bacterium]